MLDMVWTILMLLIGAFDSRKKKIPDFFVVFGMICGIVGAFCRKEPVLAERIAGMVISLAVFFGILFFAPGSFGGGDVKLSSVAGFYLGLELWGKSFVIAIMTAGIYAVYLVIRKKENRKQEIAFGPFLCLGALIVTWLK